jgi:plastocyanin
MGSKEGLRCIEFLEARCLLSTTTINSADAVPFTQDLIDPNPGNNPVVKLLVNIDNNGWQDAVVGEETTEGGGGLYIYQNPGSGNAFNTWNRYTIDPNADVYESIRAADVSGNHDADGNPVNDLIVNERGTVYWYENPLGLGENPYTTPWPQFEIGAVDQGATHEMYVSTQLSGNGELAVVDNTSIFFEVSPTYWVQTPDASYNRTEKGLYLFNSGLGPGDVDVLGTGDAPGYQVGWYENPLDYGGNPMTDQWIFHPIGPAYGNYEGGDGISYAAMDVTGSGQEDIITCDGENGEDPPFLTGGLIWWQRPANILTGTWTPHTIDSSITDVHNLVLADLQNNGQTEILAFEQDQSPEGRLLIVYNEGGTGQNWLEQTLASDADPAADGGEGGHNESVGDAFGNGYDDILTSPHGFYDFINPISLYINDLPFDGITAPSITTSPASQSVQDGQSVTFSVYATGTGPLTYQWEENGADISGANSSTYTFTTQDSDAGAQFRCIIGNQAGMIPSSAATLTLSAPPTPTPMPTPTPTAPVQAAPAPAIEFTTTPHSNPAIVTTTKTHLLAAGHDTATPGTPITYTWSFTHIPAGAKQPELSTNGTTGSGTVEVLFSKDGTYAFQCTITDRKGNSTVSSNLVEVVQTQTRFTASPSRDIIKPGSKITFSAVAYDQFDRALRVQPAVEYLLMAGKGALNAATGTFTANSTWTGNVLVEIVDGDQTTKLSAIVV